MTSPNSPKHLSRKSVTPDIMLDTNTAETLTVSLRIQTVILGISYTGMVSFKDPLKTLDLPTICNKTFDAKKEGLIKRENNCKRDFYKTFLSLPCFIF